MSENSLSDNPFRLPLKPAWLATVAERLLGLSPLARAYEQRPEKTHAAQFLDFTLTALGVTVRHRDELAIKAVPSEGALLAVANHPFGGLEGVAIARELIRCRPDLKVLTNSMLLSISELQEIFIGVDVLSEKAAAANAGGLKQALRHIRKGGALLIFPAGMVSAYSWKHRRIEDRRWNRLIGTLARRSQAACLPVHVEGRNSVFFYAAGLLHPRLRTLLLARELSNKNGKTLYLRVGRVLTPDDWQVGNEDAITDYLRLATDSLADQHLRPAPAWSELSAPIGRSELRLEIESLEPWHLLSKGDFDVYCAPYSAVKNLMPEIARCREESFRSVGEGSGGALDSDRFDRYYEHLLLWDRKQACIAGGYRVGRVDRILRAKGINGLYSRSLYRYDQRFLGNLGQALEMGRSFIVPAYQRKPSALDLLWRGIGRYVALHPQYNCLFGPVSVSRQYSDTGRALISDAMLGHYGVDEHLAKTVQPLRPMKPVPRVWSQQLLDELSDLKRLNQVIGLTDPGKTVPVLLRHYLSLNGRFVCFHLDRQFNDTLAGLIVVDLRNTPEKYLLRYLGKDGLQSFRRTQGLSCAS